MKLNSLVREYHWAWSGDPAMDAPVRDPGEDEASWKQRSEAWDQRLTIARDTGNYSGVTKAGEALSLFSLRIIPKALFDHVIDAYEAGRSGLNVSNDLLVKLAVRGVVNLTDFEGVPFKVDLKSETALGDCAPNDLLDLLQAYAAEARTRGWKGGDPIGEMADHIVRRQRGPSPK